MSNLPKSLPAPPAAPTLYMVYMTAKLWHQVAGQIDDPEDVFIMEGQDTFDWEPEGMALYVTKITTKKLDEAKRQPRPSSTVQSA